MFLVKESISQFFWYLFTKSQMGVLNSYDYFTFGKELYILEQIDNKISEKVDFISFGINFLEVV